MIGTHGFTKFYPSSRHDNLSKSTEIFALPYSEVADAMHAPLAQRGK